MLEYTAERTLPQHSAQTVEDRLVYLKQVALYTHAAQYCQGKRVLDLGCGEGYGTAILASTAGRIVATDNSLEALIHSAQEYNCPNVMFVLCDAQYLPFRQNSFDTVVSFEVIEHIPNVQMYLGESRRVCAGSVMFSTPNRLLRLLPFQKPWNTFHLREYDCHEFGRILRRVFTRVTLLGLTARSELLEIEKKRVRQNPLIAYPRMLARMCLPSSIYARARRVKLRAEPKASPSLDVNTVSYSDYSLTPAALRDAITLVAICE